MRNKDFSKMTDNLKNDMLNSVPSKINCPNCKTEIKVFPGKNICPECSAEINLNRSNEFQQ